MQLKNYDSEFCGSVPLNFINHIQPYGLLFVVKRDDLRILQVSLNIETELGVTADDIIDTSLEQYIPTEQSEALRQKFAANIESLPLSFTFTVNSKTYEYLGIVHAKEGYFLLELEKKEINASSFLDVYQQIKYTMTAIEATTDTGKAFDIIIKELKRFSGFDKIMIYQFDKDWNGTVVAEIMEEGMDSYLGLRFPASDIPRQARALYQRKPYRMIPNRDYTPVKIYPVINPETNAFTDLSDCNLRGVAPVHVEYLKNMEVVSSMSTRIIKDGALWGIISCHHRTEKYLTYESCSVFELLSSVISAKLTALQTKASLEIKTNLQKKLSHLIEYTYKKDDIFQGLLHDQQNLLDLLNISGAIIIYRKQIETIGTVPDINYVNDLLMWVQSQARGGIYVTNNLSSSYEIDEKYAEMMSGIIIISLHAEKGEYIIGFRPEVLQEVSWGGNPDDAITFEENSKNYHPRNSFKNWQQTVKLTSLPWHKEEIAIAEDLRKMLLEFTLKTIHA